jgi:surfeit locus 1 family protein
MSGQCKENARPLLAALMETPATAPERRFRPAIVPTLAAIAAIAVFVAAGNWQRGRMDQKLALRAQLEAAAELPPVAFPRTDDWAAWRYRAVVATGTFDAARQILIDNKVRGGRAGYDVVTPIALSDGRFVLVNRGWVAGGATRADLPSVLPPAGVVAVPARVNVPPAGYVELTQNAVAGPVWQNLDLARYARATRLALVPVVLEQTAAVVRDDAPARDDALARDWPAPDFGVDKHRIYMMQWYAFAATAAGLWLYYTLRRRR